MSAEILGPIGIAIKIERGEFTLTDRYSKSKVWLVFARIKKPDGELIPNYIFCKSCMKVFKYNKKTTSNLVKHKCYIDLIRAQKESAPEDGNSTLEVGETSTDNTYNSNNLMKLLTKWIVKEYQSYEVLQSESLRAIFEEIAWLGAKSGGELDVANLLPSIADVSANINEMYEQCFERVKAEISLNKKPGFALTCDVRSDNTTKQHHILLTAHYVINNVSTSRFLGFRKLDNEKNINQHILQKIKEILADFDCKLSHRLILVADSSHEFYKTVWNAQTLPCISQLLSSALYKSMKEIPEITELIASCSNLVKFLAKKVQENVLSGFLNTTQHNPWLVRFNMLKAINENWSDIEELLQQMKEKEIILTIRVSHLRAVVNALLPFEDALETLEDDNSPTLHLVIVYIHELKKSCTAVDNELNYFEFIQKLKENLYNNLEKIETDNITILHKVALFLYPLTKKLLQFNDVEKKHIEDECIRLMQNYKADLTPAVQLKPDSPTGSPVSKRRKLLSDFVESDDQDANELFNQEVQFYKSARVVNKSDFNVFNWWQMQQDNFPLLSKLCCKVFSIPATCAASKRIFSASNNLLANKSTHLATEADLEKILFLNSNDKQDQV